MHCGWKTPRLFHSEFAYVYILRCLAFTTYEISKFPFSVGSESAITSDATESVDLRGLVSPELSTTQKYKKRKKITDSAIFAYQ